MNECVLLRTSKIVASALAPHLERLGLRVISEPTPESGAAYVEVFQWDPKDYEAIVQVRTDPPPNRIGCVAIVDQADLDTYRKAFHYGAAVIDDTTDPATASEIVSARLSGDIRVPAGLLGALVGGTTVKLTQRERYVLSEIDGGRTVAQIASATCYSERHVRRVLSSIMAKSGASSRAEAAEYFREELSDSSQ